MAKSRIGKMNVYLTVEQQEDVTKDVFAGNSDDWFPALNKASDIAEVGTTSTNITIVGHGLVTGDYIINTSRDSVLREVTVVDSANFTVSAISGQASTDSISIYKYTTSKIWAKFENLMYNAVDENQVRKIITKSIVTIRYRDDILKAHRFVIGERYFEILSFYDVDERKCYSKFECREIK